MAEETSFNELRRVQLLERRSASLSEVKEDFLQECRKQLAETKAGGDAREAANYENVLRSVIELREQKILWKALRDSRTNAFSSDGLAREEKQLYTALVNLLKEFKSGLSPEVATESIKEGPAKKKPRIIEEREARKEGKEKKFMVKFLMDLPRFPWTDSADYGPFRKGQVVELNSELASYLTGKKAVEVVKK